MRTFNKKIRLSDKVLWMALLAVAATLVFSNASSLALGKSDLRRSNSGGMVYIDVTYLNPLQQTPDENLAFEIRMNTHSVNLNAYRLEDLAVLRNDHGEEVRPLEMANPGGGGHHRYGVLKFPARTPEGKILNREGVKRIVIIIKNVAGVPERTFGWNLPVE